MLNQQNASELELRDYLAVLKHRKLIVLLTVGISVAAALLVSYIQEPVYAASSRLLLQPKQSESPFDANTGVRADPTRALLTAIEVLKSPLVETEVRSRLRGAAPAVSASPVGQTDVVRITVLSTDPKRAADAANAYASAYIDVRRQQAVDGLWPPARRSRKRSTASSSRSPNSTARCPVPPVPTRAPCGSR